MQKLRRELIKGIEQLKVPYLAQGVLGFDENLCNEKGIEPYSYSVTQLASATEYRDTKATNPDYLFYEEIDDFIRDMHKLHKEEIDLKDERALISPAIFNSKGRKLKNILYMNYLWLDFEHGALRPEEFGALFPRTRLVVMSTFNHTKDQPRFRVFIPLSRPITVDAYRYLWDQVAAKLMDKGYWVKGTRKKPKEGQRLSGMDRSTRSPHSLFYAPSRKRGSKDAFFWDQKGEVLDPIVWIENGVTVPQADRPLRLQGLFQRTVPFDQRRADAAIRDWESVGPGEGNDGLWKVALGLRGLPLQEYETTLMEQAGKGRSPKDRRRQAGGIIKAMKTSEFEVFQSK